MNSLDLRLPSRRTGYIAAALMLIFTLVTSTFASAAQITDRSIQLSSSTTSATSVTYNLVFTPAEAAGATALQFCSNSPLIGVSCTAPSGISVASAAEASADSVSKPTVAASQGPVVVIEKSITAVATTLTVTGITNPSTAGPLYVRVITYDTKAHAEADYTAGGDNDGIGGAGAAAADSIDSGAVALSITSGVGVSGDVLETLLFCVSKDDTIAASCASGVTTPTLEIGELSGSVRALSSSALSTVPVYTQISTNALSGAIVSLKSSTTGCGGLSRLGASSFAAGCGIAAAGTSGTVAAGDAKIGIKAATATDQGTGSGTYTPADTSSYDTSNYKMNYASNGSSGVTSTYGDPLLDTDGAPASNKEMALTFGASISPSTPAGRYSASYSLIATGKF